MLSLKNNVLHCQHQGRLNELLSQIRMRQSAFTPAERMTERYNIEPNVLDDLKQVRKLSQFLKLIC
jgi:hypothetical protein